MRMNEPRDVGLPVKCPMAGEVDHSKDDGFQSHGSRAEPVRVEELRQDRYVRWEYEKIGMTLGHYHRCFQELLLDYVDPSDKKPGCLAKTAVDRVVVREANRAHHVFYFDVTVQYNAGHAEMISAYEDLKAGRPVDPRFVEIFRAAEEVQRKSSLGGN